jgi:RNA polymerase sigma-70 factor, ECF subfamily
VNRALGLPDSDLIRKFLVGDELAFRTLYERHTPRLRMTLLRLLGRRTEDVDDVVQDSWLAACRGLRTFRGEAQFSTWLTSIGVRVVLSHMSRYTKAGSHTLVAIEAREEGHTVAAIDLERLLARLPDQHRTVVVLHDLEGFTHEEIGAHLGIAAGTSKATLFRARAALRTAIGLGGKDVP